MESVICHHCQRSWEYEPPLGRRDNCDDCGWDSRVCFNCRFYDKNSYRECREPQAENVQDKDKGNFCGYFVGSQTMGAESKTDADKSKDSLAALFGKKDQPERSAKKGSIEDQLAEFMKKK
jgi:hypothetical protein